MKSKLQFTTKPQIAIVHRLDTAAASNMAKTLAEWLMDRKYKVFTIDEKELHRSRGTSKKLKSDMPSDFQRGPFKKIPGTQWLAQNAMDRLGLLIVLGGDGTYLRAVRLLQGKKIPILGVNLGSLGFLTPTKLEHIFSNVEATLLGKMFLKPRAMLSVELHHAGSKKTSSSLALNDIVIERGSFSQLINVGTYFDGFLLSEVKADGIIVASPTGSTAYSLAAGGPIMIPTVKALVVTPISPHSLTSRPVVLPDDGVLAFRLAGRGQKAHLIVDGQKLTEISEDDEVFVKKSQFFQLAVTEGQANDFSLLREKLKFGDRA